VAKKTRVIPGFGISMGLAILYLSLIVLIPLSTVLIETSKGGLVEFLKIITDPRTVASYKVSFGCAFLAAAINVVFGLIIAWVLVRYDFPFKKFLDGCIDLPFALPTAVAGISLTTLYSKNGWLGSILAKFGIQGAFSTFGITVALVFIGIPFVVRTVQPVLENLDSSIEEAASILGASRIQAFVRIIFPQLIAPLLTGFSLAFARGIGEYGSVVFIAGNKPMKTEIAPLLIMTKLEQFDYSGATAIALVMLIFSFFMLFVINLIQWRANKYR
jgi:sulfate transport system permease protein